MSSHPSTKLARSHQYPQSNANKQQRESWSRDRTTKCVIRDDTTFWNRSCPSMYTNLSLSLPVMIAIVLRCGCCSEYTPHISPIPASYVRACVRALGVLLIPPCNTSIRPFLRNVGKGQELTMFVCDCFFDPDLRNHWHNSHSTCWNSISTKLYLHLTWF